MTRLMRAPSVDDYARFWSKVRKTETCWIWTAGRSCGYGRTKFAGRHRQAHRIAYEATVGPIPDGMQIDHQCHNRLCVNPAHLRLATPKENTENFGGLMRTNTSGIRGVSWHKAKGKWQARVTHRGHVYAEYYDSLRTAAEAVRAMRLRLHTNNLLDRIEGAA